MGRRLGQHFLFDPSILDRIVDALRPVAGESVLEIGPGRGTLTERLVQRGVTVTAVELDPALVDHLNVQLPAVNVVAGDALKVDWPDAVGQPVFKIVGNVPYKITSPLIDRALSTRAPVIVFLVQAEVADRLAAAPGSKAYGSLSVGTQLVADVERLFTVKPGSFKPPPRVSSAVVRITPRPQAPAESRETAFRRFVTDLFGQRRKQLGRSLRSVRSMSAGEAQSVLAECGIDPVRRVETLDPNAILELYRTIHD